jgi:NAD(P)-dependent dehydrogenase (short-subunit alcohol dehydrogenase family)
MAGVSDLTFDGRVAVVTGAGAGLGRQHALLLAARGASVVVNDLGASVTGKGSDSQAARDVVDEITSGGGTAVADGHSVATAEGGAAIVQAAIDAFGRVDIVVNNAGTVSQAPFHELTLEQFDALIDVHLRGAFHVTKAAWPIMRAQQYGRVVNTTSAAGLLGMIGATNYSAAKAGLVGLTRVLAMEGGRQGIRTNAVAPIAATRMSAGALDGWSTERLDPSQVSPLVAWLAHEECDSNGEIFSAGGGRVARWFVGLTPGFIEAELTPEHVRDQLDTITREDGYLVPSTVGDELELTLRMARDQVSS